MGKKITINNSNNHKFEANLILSFEVPEMDEKYIVYSFNADDDTLVINVGNLIKKDDSYYVKDLDNDEEWNFIKKIMLQIVREDD